MFSFGVYFNYLATSLGYSVRYSICIFMGASAVAFAKNIIFRRKYFLRNHSFYLIHSIETTPKLPHLVFQACAPSYGEMPFHRSFAPQNASCDASSEGDYPELTNQPVLPNLPQDRVNYTYATVASSDPREITLGSLDTDAPQVTGFYSEYNPQTSPTLRINATQEFFDHGSTSSVFQTPTANRERHNRFTQPDEGFQVHLFGTPKTVDEAIEKAAKLVGLALSMTNGQTERTKVLNLVNLFDDYVKDNITNRTLTQLQTALNKTNKINRKQAFKSQPHTQTTTRTKVSTLNPTTSGDGELDSPSKQIRGEVKEAAEWTEVRPRNLRQSKHNPANAKPANEIAKTSKGGHANPTKKANRSIDKTRRLILTKPQGSNFQEGNAFKIQRYLNEKINQIMIDTVALSKTGNLVITTTEEFSAVELSTHMDKIKSEFPFDKWFLDEDWYQVAVHGVPIRGEFYDGTPYNLNNQEGLQTIKQEITTFNKNLNFKGAGVTWLTPSAKREIDTTYKASIVVSLQTKEQQQNILRHGLSLFGTRARTAPIHRASSTFQCHNCQGFGHYAEYCKNTTACRICSKEHSTASHRCQECNVKSRACEHTKILCANCGKDHQAGSKECERRPAPRPIFTRQ